LPRVVLPRWMRPLLMVRSTVNCMPPVDLVTGQNRDVAIKDLRKIEDEAVQFTVPIGSRWDAYA
jgi:hypothetical protein